MRNVFFFLCFLILNPRLLVLALKGVYLPVYAQFEWLKKYNFSTIIDVGANNGNVTNTLHHIFPNASIYAFEPIEKEYNQIKNKISSKNVFLENVAVSNKNGTSTFNVTDFSPASSILSLKPKYAEKLDGSIKEIEVKTITLDSYFKQKVHKGDIFLKIDTQGTEKLVLEGGAKLLKNVSVIHIEIPFFELYENQNSFADIHGYLTKLGFKYFGQINESYFYPVFGPVEAGNAIFIKTFDYHE